jgi:hypothetical protein
MRTQPRQLLLLSVLAGAACTLGPADPELASNSSALGVGSCVGLDEQSCLARPDCLAAYAVCALWCPADAPCPPCEPVFGGCFDASPAPPPPSHCDGLGEQQCNAASGCRGEYLTACPDCAPGMACLPCETSFSSCVEDGVVCGGGSGGATPGGETETPPPPAP